MANMQSDGTDEGFLQEYAQNLRDVGRGLLTPEEEHELAVRVRDEHFPEDAAVAKRIMIESNLRLVVPIARNFLGHGMAAEDLVQEGNLGLIRAVEKFDPHHGTRFSTYAVPWIRQGMMRALTNQSRTIRIPAHMVTQMNKMGRIWGELSVKLGRDPTDVEVATEMGIHPERVVSVRGYRMLQDSHISLNSPTNNDDSPTWSDVIAGGVTNPEPDTIADLATRQLESLFSFLTQQEGELVQLRYGFQGKPRSVKELSEKFHLSTQQVQALEKSALAKLRHPSVASLVQGVL